MLGRVIAGALLVVLAIGGYASYRLVVASVEVDAYRARLLELSDDFETLRAQYNEAVRRTAVTELVVQGDRLSVSIRTAEGEVQTLESPFDPEKEIYVDYVMVDGRLWIRRVFDEATPPDEGMVIDPAFVDVDWQDERVSHGKAAYRQLAEGRWVVTVTGDGSLGLARRSEPGPAELAGPPPVRTYSPMEQHVESVLRELSPREIASVLVRHVQ
jgi:hypothetical protein